MRFIKSNVIVFSAFVLLAGCIGCTRDTIEFGTIPENNYTQLSYIDTVGVQLSSVLTDSFATGGATSFLTGKYKDPLLGTVTAKSFFQLDKPAAIPDIPTTAIYDSLVFIVKLNDYYYGDTSLQQTIYVNELSQSIVTGYANNLYNTSKVAVKSPALGTRTTLIRPVGDDSITIRLNDNKGLELFTNLRNKTAEVSTTDNFLAYFKGISLTTGDNDITAVFGFSGESGNMLMRLYYHSTTPYKEEHYTDFPSLANTLAFNQVVADRTGTGITAGTSGVTEIPSSQTNNKSFSQPGTGLQLKISFPSLKGILFTEDYVKLLKAELIVRPAPLSFDRNKYKLPEPIHLVYTDGSNIAGTEVPDSTGTATMYASPVIDGIYGENTYYRFNLTSYISQLLQQSSVGDAGLYIMQGFSATAPNVDRLVLQNSGHDNYTTRLRLSVLTVKK